MLRNYFKLALKVLRRNPFFTGISLFGISFTLMILMLIAALYDAEFGHNAPLSNNDRLVFMRDFTMKHIVNDTIWVLDSQMVNGQMAYDSTYTLEDRTNSTSISSPSFHLLDRYLREPEGSVRESFFSNGHTFDLFLNNRKLSLDVIFSDANYWELFDFQFTEGQAYTAEHIDQASPVAIITDRTARRYFGRTTEVIGEEINLGDRHYQVIGVVGRGRMANSAVAADVYLPYTTLPPSVLNHTEYQGGFTGAYLAATAAQRAQIKESLVQRTASVPVKDPEEYNHYLIRGLTYGEVYARQLVNQEDPAKGLWQLRLVFGLLIGFFMLLPTLNLINLNISRIMERSAEIGVRKAFGAHSATLLYQFVFENVILTFVGGAIGLVMAFFLLRLINQSEVLPDIVLAFNPRLFLYSIIIILGFGILSGLLPAWRMSRFHIADALKSQSL